MENLNNYLSEAVEMAKHAGKIQLDFFRGGNLDVHTKLNDSDVVTAADNASEQFIIDSIHQLFPGHSILSEESGAESTGSDRLWIIDPLDGTTNFSNGLPVFSISIALAYKENVMAGVVYAPYLNELFYATADEGAFLNGHPIRCSLKSHLSESVLTIGMPYDKTQNPDNNLQEIETLATKVRGIRRFGSAALDLCYVGAGFFDGYWELNLKRWDVSAGMLIAKEAGAEIHSIRTDRNYSLMAASPGIASELLAILEGCQIK